MKYARIALILSAVLAGCFPAFAASTFEEAAADYKAGHFDKAAAGFEKIVDGRPSAAAYYNLGSSYFRAGKKGRALAALLKARAISPRDKDIDWNLRIIRAAVPDSAVERPRNFIKERIVESLNRISADEAAVAVTISLALFLIAAVLSFFFLKGSRFLTAVSVLFLLFSSAVFFWHAREAGEPTVVIVEKNAQARYGPSVKETAAFALREGAEARLLDRTKDWYFVRAAGGGTGWIPESSAEVV